MLTYQIWPHPDPNWILITWIWRFWPDPNLTHIDYCQQQEKNKKAQLTQGLRATAPSFQDGRQPPS